MSSIKTEEHEKIDAQVKEFLDKGNSINEVEFGILTIIEKGYGGVSKAKAKTYAKKGSDSQKNPESPK